MMPKPILVAYLNIGNLPSPEIANYVEAMSKVTKKDDLYTIFFIPIRDGETRVECVANCNNAKYIVFDNGIITDEWTEQYTGEKLQCHSGPCATVFDIIGVVDTVLVLAQDDTTKPLATVEIGKVCSHSGPNNEIKYSTDIQNIKFP